MFVTTSVNSNGTNLNKLLNIKTLDNIALSRHHYNEDKNKELMKVQTISNGELLDLEDRLKKKVHLSCNLIRGYIDSPKEIHKYLEFTSKLNINLVGNFECDLIIKRISRSKDTVSRRL